MWKVILIIVAVAMVAGAISGATFIRSTEEDKTMKLTNKAVPNTAIPPIDASAPTTIETATFALG